MNADAVETGLLATGDERRQLRQGPTDRNAKSDAKPGHLTSVFRSAPPSLLNQDIGLRQTTAAKAASMATAGRVSRCQPGPAGPF
jgi:hypothetical protein